MGMLDVELSDRLIEDIKDLAERHYGDASRIGELSGDAARRSVTGPFQRVDIRLSDPERSGGENT